MKTKVMKRKDINENLVAVASFTPTEWLGTLVLAHEARFPNLVKGATYRFVPTIDTETLILTVEVTEPK